MLQHRSHPFRRPHVPRHRMAPHRRVRRSPHRRYAMHMLYADIPMRMLQSMMWHKSVNSTNVYKKVLAAGCRVQGAGCRVQGAGSDNIAILKRV
ncbi:phage integrase family protein [Candidatus Pantoea gossypiicola]|uniref:Phage integrase family protein n=1 Tax=Candidatus Pantoea gossypiicola TaxID=2608008 RepID=A0AB34CD13_9GAMM|nr:phage integrase family protein [Pantoea sp. M_4]KAA6119619.1 phage integrase family protein [Pantoea gossypiicola]